MNESKFKKIYKPPACTEAPWKYLIPSDQRDEVMRKIRAETIEAYGYPMDECPKRQMCLTKSCIGRPLPWKSETAKPFLEQLKTTHSINNDELFLNNCNACPIAKSCTYTCPQVNDWMKRQMPPAEPMLIYQENLENYAEDTYQEILPTTLPKGSIPWDVLTDTRKKVVEKYIYEQKDFLTISKELDLNNQARVKYEFYSALTRLSKYAAMREAILNSQDTLDDFTYLMFKDVFFDNKTITEVAKENLISKQNLQQIIARFITKHMVKWPVFVKKKGNKLIYNVPEVLK